VIMLIKLLAMDVILYHTAFLRSFRVKFVILVFVTVYY